MYIQYLGHPLLIDLLKMLQFYKGEAETRHNELLVRLLPDVLLHNTYMYMYCTSLCIHIHCSPTLRLTKSLSLEHYRLRYLVFDSNCS